jgi:hypothetical protein
MKLFQFLKVKNIPRKYWNNNARWDIVEVMHHIVVIAILKVIHQARFLAIRGDEMMMVDD